jgi:hypothetical protein
VNPGSFDGLETHGRKRLLPFFGPMRLSTIDEDAVRRWIGELSSAVQAGEVARKTPGA